MSTSDGQTEKAPQKVKVTIEWGDMKHSVEGSPELVVKEVVQFATRVLPNYSLASKLTFSPDYSSMVDDLSEVVKLTHEGEAIMLRSDMSAENSIAIVLLAARVANAVGSRPNVEMSPEAISKSIGRAIKTVRNTLATLAKTGMVDRTSDGGYRLTIQGIRKAHEVARSMTIKSAAPTINTTIPPSEEGKEVDPE